MILEAKKITFRYDKNNRYILKDFNLTLQSDKRLGLVAPSGFGKTTLCKILSGYENAYEGEVLLDKQPIQSYKSYCPVQMIWQHPELVINPRMHMGDVLAEGDNIEQRIIDGLGIEKEWLKRFPAELSGGELQRFCIARALGKATRFILADEISAMLDLITQAQIWHFLLDEVKKRNIGLLAVSHYEPLLYKICEGQILVLTGQAV